ISDMARSWFYGVVAQGSVWSTLVPSVILDIDIVSPAEPSSKKGTIMCFMFAPAGSKHLSGTPTRIHSSVGSLVSADFTGTRATDCLSDATPNDIDPCPRESI